MKNRTLPKLILVISAIIFLVVILITGSRDKVGPYIDFSDDCVSSFDENDDVELLLQGITALDDKDGDVTDSIRIQNINVFTDKGSIIVHYSAKDSSNNITEVSREIAYTGTKEYIDFSILYEAIFKEESGDELKNESGEKSVEANINDESSGSLNNDLSSSQSEASSNNDETSANTEDTSTTKSPEETTTKATEPTEELENETIVYEPIDRAEVDETGKPQIRMKYSQMVIKKGEKFNYMSALAEWYDDKDDVSRRVIIVGDYDENVPGTYNLTYYVTDSDKNTSNKEKLVLIVQ